MSRSPHLSPSTPSPRPYRSIASQMTSDHDVAVEEASAAELRGDWSAAFEHHRSVPMFAESHHGSKLHLLAMLGDRAPRWLVTRFVAAMAHRLEMYGQPERSGRALQHVIPLLFPHGIPVDAMGCDHVEEIVPHIYGRDWVARQTDVYDLGGLRELMTIPAASGALLQGEYVAEWAEAPMGGYRVVGADGAVLTVADAFTGEELELLDLGLTSHHPVGTHVLGRVVPTDTAPGRLLESRPLPIDRRIAREVAARPDRWLDVVATRTRSRALPPAFSLLDETSLSADLPQYAWASLLGHPIGEQLPRPASTMVAEALKTVLQRVGDPEQPATQRHLVSELLLDELMHERLLARFATAKYHPAWSALADALPDPARERCEQALWMIDACTVDDELAG